MDLLLWRHAEASEPTPGQEDMQRTLTVRGRKQAARMAAWLDRQLPENTRILVSPACRTEQTVEFLGRPYRLHEELAPGRDVDAALTLAHWPASRQTTLLVGHQPMLGQLVSQLLGFQKAEASIRKGAVWWIRHRVRNGAPQTLLISVQSPDLL